MFRRFAIVLLVLAHLTSSADECFTGDGSNVVFNGKCTDAKVSVVSAAESYTVVFDARGSPKVPIESVDFDVSGCKAAAGIAFSSDGNSFQFDGKTIVTFPVELTVSSAGLSFKGTNGFKSFSCSPGFTKDSNGYLSEFSMSGKTVPLLSARIKDVVTSAQSASGIGTGAAIGIGIGSFLAFVGVLVGIGVIVYCCCWKKTKVTKQEAPAGVTVISDPAKQTPDEPLPAKESQLPAKLPKQGSSVDDAQKVSAQVVDAAPSLELRTAVDVLYEPDEHFNEALLNQFIPVDRFPDLRLLIGLSTLRAHLYVYANGCNAAIGSQVHAVLIAMINAKLRWTEELEQLVEKLKKIRSICNRITRIETEGDDPKFVLYPWAIHSFEEVAKIPLQELVDAAHKKPLKFEQIEAMAEFCKALQETVDAQPFLCHPSRELPSMKAALVKLRDLRTEAVQIWARNV